MYREDQPAFAMLQMLELPSVGGDTMWADLAASYEALSEPVKTLLEGRYAYHVHPDYYLGDEERSRRYEATFGRPLTAAELAEQKEQLSPHIHPLVRRLPDVGDRRLGDGRVDTGCSMPSADWQAAAAITNKWGLATAHITASDVSAAYKTGLG